MVKKAFDIYKRIKNGELVTEDEKEMCKMYMNMCAIGYDQLKIAFDRKLEQDTVQKDESP